VTNTTFVSRIKDLTEMLELLLQEKEVLGLKGGTCASNEGVISWKSSKKLPTSFPEVLVYNDDRIKEHFEHKAWVYVSEYFDVVRLTKEIIDRLGHS